MSTPYSTQNQLFSDSAHIAAQSIIYPILFNAPKEKLSFETTSLSTSDKNAILDGEMAVDRIVTVSVDWFKAPIEFTVQERFRRLKFAQYKDITITEWNHKTNRKSELYKLNAGIFVYGYYGDDVFEDWIAINTVGLLHRLVQKKPNLEIKTNPRSRQTFYTFGFERLRKAGVILCEKNSP